MPDQPTLITKRLTLRPFIPDDAFDVERFAGMREIADTTLSIPHPYPHGAAAEWILTHAPAWENGSTATFAIVETRTGRLVGVTSLMINREHRRAELGYWIAFDRWNQGYATESNQRLIDFGFEVLGITPDRGSPFPPQSRLGSRDAETRNAEGRSRARLCGG